ncbi:hypothetical protein M0811_03531 [Anaeramoeba ignava]|uniref:TLC domain-containing protein n=1 Tax=Anaeramoeba ignava TaxID=1746090 RepID=A0A9Q0L5C2_ANAIG|nr:hypothetical protein M0811_03531 [Anaeramoeba ignava]
MGNSSNKMLSSDWDLNKTIGVITISIISGFIYYLAKQVSIKLLVFTHSVFSTISSIVTMIFQFDPAYSIMITSVYLPYHTYYLRDEPYGTRDKWSTYIHHFLGFAFGVTELFLRKNEMAYLCIQANEASNIFLQWYRWKKTNISGLCFAIAFFITRVPWDTFYVIPFYLPYTSLYIKIFFVPFYTIQYIWLYKTFKKVHQLFFKKKETNEKEKLK